MPDQDEGSHPTIDYHWIHCMTLPRQLTLSGQKLIQQPLPELKAMRRNEKKIQINMHGSSGTLPVENPERAEILIEDIDTQSGFSISIRGTAAFSFDKEEGLLRWSERASTENEQKRDIAASRICILCICLLTRHL